MRQSGPPRKKVLRASFIQITSGLFRFFAEFVVREAATTNFHVEVSILQTIYKK